MTRLLSVSLLLMLTLAQPLTADDADRPGVEFFEAKIRPVLVEHCYECHSASAKKLRGGLLLDTRDGIRKGGESGPALVPKDVASSLLIEALRYESYEMPPKGKLPDAVIADFVKWVEMGAPDPRDKTVTTPAEQPAEIDIEAGRQFWSFQPPRRRDVPPSKHDMWCRSDIDRWIAHGWESDNLEPAPDADRRTLIRRATFDLIGLPPSPEEIDEFLADPDPTPVAFAKVVDRLLESPHFGERWGRHWLDVARFSESTGGGRSMLFDVAWRYRDYVIDAFNADKPFDRFIVEQIAGDLLPHDDYRDRQPQLVATAFLALGPTNYELQDKTQLEMDVIDEQIDTVGRAFLGMTLGCARCHDHKFDPIPTTDYYALAGIFRSTKTLIHDNVSKWVTRPLPVEPERQRRIDEHARAVGAAEKESKSLEQRIAKLKTHLPMLTLDDEGDVQITGDWKTSAGVKGFVGKGYRYASGDGAAVSYRLPLEKPGRYDVRVSYTPHANRSPNALVIVRHQSGETPTRIDQTQAPDLGVQFVSVGTFDFGDAAEVTISTEGTKGTVIADAVQLVPARGSSPDETKLLDEIAGLERRLPETTARLKSLQETAPPAPPEVVSVDEAADMIGDWHVCIRGNAKNLGPLVPRGFVTVALAEDAPQIGEDVSGRLELAQWIANPDNPLTARVAVNRIWHHLFGAGLVRTVDNFGAPGERPSHPALLDDLALQFIDNGWSQKTLIRQIMLSRTYQLSSEGTVEATQHDPENRRLSHQNRRRLDAEAIHDAILALSGQLDLTVGGDTIRPGTKSEYGYEFDVGRRAVYLPVFRNRLPDLFTVFDFPDPNLSIGCRTVSTLSTQALFLMNSPFLMQQARHAAERLLADPEINDDARLDLLYNQALGRPLSDRERTLAREFLTADLPSNEEERLSRWTGLCKAVIASVDFRYIE